MKELIENGTPQEAPYEWRRGERRLDVCVGVDIKVLCTTATSRAPERGRTLNVGADSLAVVCREPISTGSRVKVTLPSGKFCEADVIHCTQTIGGHKIGMKLTS